MMPGGHLATSLALAGTAYAATGSVETAAGCVLGGFLIDVDHYLDYLLFEKQWRRPSPLSFLSYYFKYSPRRLVLPLHSAELMTVLLALILFHPWPLLVGYWFGAAMHLTFDILVNGEFALKRAIFFYIFSYRAAHRFAASELMDRPPFAEGLGKRPLLEFFQWRTSVEPRPPTAESHRSEQKHPGASTSTASNS
jgi:hypothetical protein